MEVLRDESLEKRTVLFVDDEINILSSLRRSLADQRYHCIFANSAGEALDIMERQKISVIVTDMKMPVMDGLKLLKIVKEKYPETVRVVLSGYTQLPQVLATVNQAEIFKFIAKPWRTEEELIPVIEQSIQYYNLLQEREELKKSLEKRNQLYQNVLKLTQERMTSDQKNFDGVKKLCAYVFERLSKNNAGNAWQDEAILEADKKIDLYRILLLDYLQNAMSGSIRFTEERLVKDLEEMFLEEYPDFKFRVENKIDYSCYGNYRLFIHTLYTMVKMLMSLYEEPKVQVSILSSVEEDIKLLVVIGASGNAAKQEDVRVRHYIAFVSEILRLYSGSLDFKQENERYVAKLSILFKKV